MKRRQIIMLVIAVDVVVAIGVGGWFWWKAQEDAAFESAKLPARALASCLLGVRPVTDREARLREMELASLEETGAAATRWPLRCNELVAPLDERLANAGSRGEPVRAALRAATTFGEAAPNLPPKPDRVAIRNILTALETAGLPLAAFGPPGLIPAQGVPTPGDVPVLLASTSAVLERVAAADFRVASSTMICEVMVATDPTRATCRPAPSRLGGDLEISQAGEGVPAFVRYTVDPIQRGGTYDGATRISQTALDSFSLTPGSGVFLELADGRARLSPWPDAGALLGTAFELPAGADARLVGMDVVWVAAGHVFVRAMTGESNAQDLGAGSLALHVPGCISGPMHAFRTFEGSLVSRATESGAWTVDTSWQNTVPITAPLTCSADGVSATWIDPPANGAVIVRRRACTGAGAHCEDGSALMQVIASTAALTAATDVSGKTLFVYTTPTADGRDFGLRARLAPIVQLPTTRDIILFDSNGVSSTNVQVTARGPRAYVTFEREGGTRAVTIDAEGTVSAVLRVP